MGKKVYESCRVNVSQYTNTKLFVRHLLVLHYFRRFHDYGLGSGEVLVALRVRCLRVVANEVDQGRVAVQCWGDSIVSSAASGSIIEQMQT